MSIFFLFAKCSLNISHPLTEIRPLTTYGHSIIREKVFYSYYYIDVLYAYLAFLFKKIENIVFKKMKIGSVALLSKTYFINFG